MDPGTGRLSLQQALADRERVLRAFLDADGRLVSMPAKHRKRLVVLDHVARVFEPGVRYPETEVNALVRAFHDDVAMLRRYLVDEGFLERDHGVYWRSGGTVVL
ncbi:DUF2087 domain-containing protein [Quadrisphaera sp. DSM 44207]|uniref:DUF2087 domain-containing protein n=1 Tax=Quadrisphaera sp. DSM 44207 TaxID=1881057 RepID=UPI001C40A4DE|nr:DUF2087 domain-containing protein [Quadrisphaera sp. DSM 44207]